MNLKEKFQSQREKRSYIKIDSEHQFDWYVGYNPKGEESLAIVVDEEYKELESSKFIKVHMEMRTDKKYNLFFDLLDEKYENIFHKFCDDLIETTREYRGEKILNFITWRWNMWKSTFKNSNTNLLSENEIKCLIGELYFLKNYMFERYGMENSIKAWQGPSKQHKDFEILNTWYEIKATNDSSESVRIHSLQQLDSNDVGELVVVKLSKNNETTDSILTLNYMIKEINAMIKDFIISEIFWEKLAEAKYFYDRGYDEYKYDLYNISRYSVESDDFPRIKEKDINNAITKVEYDISLVGINKYKIEG